MNKKALLFLVLWARDLCGESWSSIGSTFSGMGSSILNGIEAMGEGMIGATPSGYNYNFRVFNGSNTSAFVEVQKSKNIMGARFSTGNGDKTTLSPGQDSGNTFASEHLYFSINITGAHGLNFSEDHYTLGARNDPTVYFYHLYNDKNSGYPDGELLGGGYTTSSDFSGCIENKSSLPTTVTFTLNSSNSKSSFPLKMTIPDIDPQSFNFLTTPTGYIMRPSKLEFDGNFVIEIQSQGIATIKQTQSTSNGLTQSKLSGSVPCTYNYIFNGQAAFETGLGPGHFDQPGSLGVIRDISPVECQIYYENIDRAEPLGQLLAFDVTGESLWYVYKGYGWSQTQKAVIQYPCGQIKKGECASCFVIRPSQQSLKNDPTVGRFFIVRLSVSEQSVSGDQQRAQTFLKNMVTGKISITGLGAQEVIQTFPFVPDGSLMTYPNFSQSSLSEKINVTSLNLQERLKLLGTVLPDSVGFLYDNQTGISGYIMLSDLFYPYGMGPGPFYYLMYPPYLDLNQLIGALCSYASATCFSALTQAVYDELLLILAQTVIGWVQLYQQNKEQVKQSIATFLALLGQGNLTEIKNQFSAVPFVAYADSKFLAQLSPQGIAFLKMLLYGPCSMSQAPIYHRAGTSYFSLQDGWPSVSVYL